MLLQKGYLKKFNTVEICLEKKTPTDEVED